MIQDLNAMQQEMHKQIEAASTIAVSGHTNPDGDALGACLALCTYILDRYPEKQVDILLEPVMSQFYFLKNVDHIIQKERASYDLYFSLDCADEGRLRLFRKAFARASCRLCIDHHVTNTGFGDHFLIVPDASSTCEILYDLFDKDYISRECAQALFTGIIHDTGVFRHSNTTRKVMETAGDLMGRGIDSERIINETFYEKTYRQNLVLGRALLESILILSGRMVFSIFRRKDFRFYGVDKSDMEGIVSQLKLTKGVEVALFMYEIRDDYYKVSLRSTDRVDVSRIASLYGGGGHKKAAGCNMTGTARDIVNNIAANVEAQLDGVS